MSNKASNRVAVLGFLGAVSLLAQDIPLTDSAVKFMELPKDAPVAVMGFNMGPSRTWARGTALVLDLNLSFTLKNTSLNRIHGVRLRVVSHEVPGMVGGAATVFQASMDVGPGDTFPVRIKAQLMRPAQMSGGPLVQVNLDGVLFQDYSFYGENKLESRRIMTANEMEAKRDRDSLKDAYKRDGLQGLKAAMVQIQERQNSVPQLKGTVRNGAATNLGMAVSTPERKEQVACLRFPGAPVEAVQGSAIVVGGEVRTPNIEVRNVSNPPRPVKHVELGLVLTDPSGRDYMAGSVPSAAGGFALPAGGSASVRPGSTLSFAKGDQPVIVQKLASFVSQVEFQDGTVWIPSRRDLDNPLLVKVMTPSAEEERLLDLYLRKGPTAVAEELKKF